MNKYISVNKEGMKKLMATFRVGERCIKNALAYRTDSELARKIQFTAVKHYGGCTYYNIPEGEFFFDSDSCAFAVYPNGAEVRLDKQTGEGIVYDPKGNEVARREHIMLIQIPELTRMAKAL